MHKQKVKWELCHLEIGDDSLRQCEELEIHGLPERGVRVFYDGTWLEAVNLQSIRALIEGAVELRVPREAVKYAVDSVVCHGARHTNPVCARSFLSGI